MPATTKERSHLHLLLRQKLSLQEQITEQSHGRQYGKYPFPALEAACIRILNPGLPDLAGCP